MTSTESDALKFWEGMFGNATTASAGNFTISYTDFMARFDAHLLAAVEEVIGESVPYEKLGICPVCSDRMYACSCVDAQEFLIRAQLERLAVLVTSNKDKDGDE